MGLVQIGVKVDQSVKDRIKTLVESGKYRDMTDFAAKAILEKLEREDTDELARFKKSMMELLISDPDIHEILIRKKEL